MFTDEYRAQSEKSKTNVRVSVEQPPYSSHGPAGTIALVPRNKTPPPLICVCFLFIPLCVALINHNAERSK